MSIVGVFQLLRSPRRAFSKEGGFSLVEVMAALFIFTLLTLGLVPLLTSSIRGSNTARADTIGKNAALKAMERVRGLPFYVSYATSTTKVDLLDLYYPDAETDVVIDGRTLYRIVCPFNSLANPACPRDVPTGYTIAFEAQFVDPVATGTQPTPGETATSYANVDPATVDPDYSWESAETDSPPRQIVQMAITATWSVGNRDESYTLTSLLSDRSFGGRKIKGQASLDYGVDLYVTYDTLRNGSGPSRQSNGNMFIGTSESDIEGRRLSTARHTTTAGRAEISRPDGATIAFVDGATSTTLAAPPDQEPGNVNALDARLTHPDFAREVLAFGPSLVQQLEATATTSNASPLATGNLEITSVVNGTNEYAYTKSPQLNQGDYNALNLSTGPSEGPSIVNLVRWNGTPGPLPGITSPVNTGRTLVGGSIAQAFADRVYSQATFDFDRMTMLQTNWIPDPAPIEGGGRLEGARGAVVVIEDFRAAVSCHSRTDGTGDGEAQYSGTLYYWYDPVQDGSREPMPVDDDDDDDGARYRRITFNVTSASAGADPLAAVKAENGGNGPLVYDHPSANQRIYLFGTTLGKTIDSGSKRAAYLTEWNSITTTEQRTDASTDAAGAAVSSVNSSVEGALEIELADLDTTKNVSTSTTVSMGSLSCYAQDAR